MLSILRNINLKSTNRKCSTRQFLFHFYFLQKTNLDISCESSAKQTNHMKFQDLFSLKIKIMIRIIIIIK